MWFSYKKTVDEKPCIETFPINLNSNDEGTENYIFRKPFIRPPIPFLKICNWHTSDKNNYLNVASNEPIDLFIDELIEGQETKLIENHETILSFSIFQRKFESHLPLT